MGSKGVNCDVCELIYDENFPKALFIDIPKYIKIIITMHMWIKIHKIHKLRAMMLKCIEIKQNLFLPKHECVHFI